jgi:hypothetical protein
VLLAILIVSALTADTRISAAALGGAEQGVAPSPAATDTPFDRQGMWIWYVDRSNGGSTGQIVAQAQQAGVGTLYIKAGDGGHAWPQFNEALVAALHQGGLDVCAWQLVYGERPVDEAKVGATTVRRGADCLVIDAEGQYEGKYAAADRKQTRAVVRAFQQGQGLSVDGVVGTTTWSSLFNFDPVRPRWAGRRAKRGGGATASRAFPPRRPLSASLPAKANEIDPGPAP